MREIFEYLIVGIDRGILTGKGAIFVLYAYFVIQPLNPWQRINIPITNEELKNLKCLVQAYCDNQVSYGEGQFDLVCVKEDLHKLFN